MINASSVLFKEKRVLIRADFNVPLDSSSNVLDDSRILSIIPTINKIITSGGKAILLSHLGRPKNPFEKQFSLVSIAKRLSEILKKPVSFCNDCIGEEASNAIKKLAFGEVLVLENLRFYKEEASGDLGFAKKLASLGDIYVNDAFGVSHRNHASVGVIPLLFKEKYLGGLIQKEISVLNNVLNRPKKGFTAIIGGAKISSKINVITSLFDKVDAILIGGGMSYTFAKAMGGDIGSSLIEEKCLVLAKSLINLAKKENVSLVLPVDSINGSSFTNDCSFSSSNISRIPESLIGMDIGPKSIAIFEKYIFNSKTIIWNGPMGVFEFSNFATGTKKIGKAICSSTKSGAFSLVGGGDSLSALKQFNLTNEISFLSTGGGAMLSYLEGDSLPGITPFL